MNETAMTVDPFQNPHDALSPSRWARRFKRPFDLLGAVVLLIVVSPFLLLAALLVKVCGSGPVFFRQVRTGLDGCEFVPLKFRTMSAEHRHDPTEIIAADHPSITRVGRILRAAKIDELPQLINILRGQMSFVGPRPTLPEQTQAYDAFQRRRLLVRPGLTGLAQVNGNTAIPWEERIKYDVYYVRHCSLLMDLGILLKTVAVIVMQEHRFARPFANSRFAARVPNQSTGTPVP